MKTLLLNFWKIKTILIIVLLLFVSENINGQAACAPNTWVAGGPYTQNVSVVKSNFSGSWKNYKCVFNNTDCNANAPSAIAWAIWQDQGACSSCSAVNAGSIGGGTTICAGSTSNLTNSANASGGNGSSYSYQWETSFNGGAWTNASGTSTSATYTTAVLAAGSHQFRRKVTSSTCGSATTGAVTVTVNPASVAGSISGGTTPLCQGTATGTMTLSGHTGSIVQWQKRVNSGSWTNISNTATTYSETPSSAGTWEYRAEVKSGVCASVFSSTRTIVVNPSSVGGSVSGGTTPFCQGTATGTMTLSGHTGSIVQWQKRVNSGSWTNISNTATTYSETPSSAGTWEYRAEVKSGACASVFSTVRTIVVDPTSVGGTIAGSSTVCTGSNSTVLTLSGHTGSVTRWESSLDNFATAGTSITNTTTTLTATNLTATTTYRAVVTSGSCAVANSATAAVTVSAAVNYGTVASGNQTICNGATPSSMSVSGAVGSGSFTYQWYSRSGIVTAPTGSSTTGWTSLGTTGGANTATYTPASGISSSTTYACLVTPGASPTCGTATWATSARQVTVNATNTVGSASSAPTLCVNTALTNITITTAGATGISNSGVSGANGLPAGVSASWTSNTITISGTPTASGPFTYSIPLTGGCGSVSATGTITVSPIPSAPTSSSASSVTCARFSANWSAAANATSYLLDVNTASGFNGTAILNNVDVSNVTTYSVSGLSPSTTYYYRVRANNTCGTSASSSTITQATSAPLSVSPGGVSDQLLVWLKADAGTSSLSTSWQDQGCGGNNYTTVSGPTVIASDLNYNPAIEILSGGFDGPAGAALGNDWTIFFVTRLLASDDWGRFIEGSTSTDFILGYSDAYSRSLQCCGVINRWSGIAVNSTAEKRATQIFSYKRESTGATLDARFNGQLLQTFNTNSSGAGTFLDIGSGYYALNGGESSDGRINEFIIYKKALSAAEILKVEAYLAAKYGLQLNTTGGGTNGDLVSSGGTTYWDASANTGYSNEVVVIGKDNSSGLTQKQSKSTDDSVRVFVSTLAANNSTNAGTITNDQSFIAMGHNGAKLKANYGSNNEKPVGITSRLAREWKLVNTNFADNFSIEVEWDSIGNVSLSDLRLLVDDDGDFSNAAVYSSANGLTFAFGSIIVKGISTSMIPLNSTKYITIGSASESTPLPVQLIYFNGELMEDNVLLSWETASEINNEKFILEKSFDANNWFKIAEVKGAGNSTNILTYSFVDDALISGTQYYRLTQIDFDGTKETFEAIDVSKIATAPFEIKVFPNPMKEEVKVSFFADKQGYSRFRIYAESGQEMYGGLVGTLQGENSFNFNTSSFAEGTYIFIIEKENGVVSTVKVVK